MTFPLTAGGEPLPGYRLVGPAGRGSFGEVWKADRPGGGQVALKFIPLDRTTTDVEQRALDAVAAVRHPNLLSLFGTWTIDPFLVVGMELADRTLKDRLDEVRAAGGRGIPWEELLEYLAGVARGLDYLNAPRHPHPQGGPGLVGFQHRDVKPTNLFLVGDGAKVGDWSLLRLLDGPLAGHSGHLTPNYAAPEFFRGQTSRHSDQYCLAVTAYFLLTGRLPFSGDPFQAHLHRPPELELLTVSQRRVFECALAKAPDARWPSCRAFVDALRASGQPPSFGPGGTHPSGASGLATVPAHLADTPRGLNVPRFHYGSVVPPSSSSAGSGNWPRPVRPPGPGRAS